MNKELYIAILKQTLLPFVSSVYPDGHRMMADNDPKHTSRTATTCLEENGIHWWRTPAESPDLNPIENVWHELKASFTANFPMTFSFLKLGYFLTTSMAGVSLLVIVEDGRDSFLFLDLLP